MSASCTGLSDVRSTASKAHDPVYTGADHATGSALEVPGRWWPILTQDPPAACGNRPSFDRVVSTQGMALGRQPNLGGLEITFSVAIPWILDGLSRKTSGLQIWDGLVHTSIGRSPRCLPVGQPARHCKS